jgi:hypothetical protein
VPFLRHRPSILLIFFSGDQGRRTPQWLVD